MGALALRRMPGHSHFGEGLLGLWAPSIHSARSQLMFQIHILSPGAIDASASVLRQAGHGSAPGAQPHNHGGCWSVTFTQRAAVSLAGVMPRFCPSDVCVEALPPAPLSGPAFGGEVFEQVIELNEAI